MDIARRVFEARREWPRHRCWWSNKGRSVGIAALLVLAAYSGASASDGEFRTSETGNDRVNATPTLNLGTTLLWSVVIKPIKQPVSTAYQALTLGMEGGSRLIEAPLKAMTATQIEPVPPLRTDRPGMDLAEWERALDVLTATRQTAGDIRFLVDGKTFYPALYEAIGSAQRSIDVRLYIFDTDDIALSVADTLRQRSSSVRTRVLLDGIGSAWAATEPADSLPANHRAPPSIAAYLRHDSKIRLRLQANPLLAGDHTKSIVIDGERAFLGGMNIGREYRHEWHDMMVELRGPVVEGINSNFRSAWARASIFGDLASLADFIKRKRVRTTGAGAKMRLLMTRPGDDQIRRARMAAIARAQRYIYLETPYLADNDVVDALIQARGRGVDVRVILPEDNDSPIMANSNRTAARRLALAGVRIFGYPGFTHAKAMIVDGWAIFGSSNMDWLSHAVNREMDVATADPDIVARLHEKLFRPDFAVSTEHPPVQPLTVAHGIVKARH